MSFYFSPHPQSSTSSNSSSSSHHNHHGHGRSRRTPRLATSGSSQTSHKSFRGVRSMKELTEPFVSSSIAIGVPVPSAYPDAVLSQFARTRARLEAAKSFDLDDDLEFCPSLLTDDDLFSIHSASSDHSSSSAGSPEASPLQQQIQPSAAQFQANFSHPFLPASFQPSTTHQMRTTPTPQQARTKNPIAIVDPTTGMRVASPPLSISPARLPGSSTRRGW